MPPAMSDDQSNHSDQPNTPQHSELRERSNGTSPNQNSSTCQANDAHDPEVPAVYVNISYDASQQPETDYASILIDDARPTRNGAVYHGDGVWPTLASALIPELTEEDSRVLGLDDVDGGISSLNQRREDANSQGLESTHFASGGTVRAHANSRTPNNTPQVNGESDIRDHRAGVFNSVSHDQPAATNISRALAEAFHDQNAEPSVCISEFMTYSTGWDLFHNNSSGIPPTTAAENPAFLSAPQINHFNAQADHSPLATYTATNSTSGEEAPAHLSGYLPQVDSATQEQHELAWAAEPPGLASNPIRRPDTPLPTSEIEYGNAEARGSPNDIPSVYVSSLRLRTPTGDMNAVLAGSSQYSEDEASSAALGEDTVTGSQANPTNPRTRHRITPLADSNPNATGVANEGVRNHNRRAPRPVPSLRQMTSGEHRAFWAEFSNPENNSRST